MTKRQLGYLRKVHEPIIAERGVTQRHYDIMLQYLTEAMRTNGAEVGDLCRGAICLAAYTIGGLHSSTLL